MTSCGGTESDTVTSDASGSANESTGNSEGTDTVYNLRFGHSQADSNPIAQTVRDFSKLVEKKTDGRVKITDYPNMILGDDVAMLESVQMGTLDMCFAPTSTFVNFEPGWSAFSVPMIFNDYAHANAALDGDFGKSKLSALEQYNFKGIGYWTTGFLNFITIKKGIAEVADLKGLTIRCMESAPILKWLALYGANPVPMAWSEVPTAIQTGAIHGTMIGPIVGYTAKLSAVSEYYTNNWGVMYSPVGIVINKQLYDKMPTDIQNALAEAYREITPSFYEMWQNLDEEYTQKMVDDGIKLIDSTPEQIQEMREYTREKIWPVMIEDNFITQNELDTIRTLAN
jgi:tripartite ATP-independent transporter DctP family solute receptor